VIRGMTIEDLLRAPGVESISVGGVPTIPATAERPQRPLAVSDGQPEPKPKLVAAEYDHDAGRWVIPIRLESEANMGGKLSAALARKSAVKRIVSRAIAPGWRVWGPVGDAIRAGQPASIRVVRLGGRGLDTGNLWRAVKPVEDAIATMLGCDDGAASWKASFEPSEEPGGPFGVRIEIGLK
jgi:hypothetical protein